jgi:hypothetical protein
MQEFCAALERAALPPAAVAMSVALAAAVRAGEFDLSGPTLETLLGRAPAALKVALQRLISRSTPA